MTEKPEPTTNGSGPDGEKKGEDKFVPPPLPTDAELRKRHRELRKEDWEAGRAHRMCGVADKFQDARMTDYDPEAAMGYLTAIWEGSWFLAWGPVGTGKTHLLSALIRSFFIHGFDSYLVYVPRFLSELKSSFGNNEVFGEDLIYRLEMTPILALDDLGTEKLTEFNAETLTNIINARYNRELRTIISANYGLERLEKRYARLADRIRENAEVHELIERRPERG